MVGDGEAPVGRLGVTKDNVASLLHVDFIADPAESLTACAPEMTGNFTRRKPQ